MNERIRKFAEQSGINIPDDSVYNGHIYRNSIEKFAELIVAECLDAIQRVNDGLGSHDPGRIEAGRSVLTWAYHDIQHRFKMGRYKDQEHFGVEE